LLSSAECLQKLQEKEDKRSNNLKRKSKNKEKKSEKNRLKEKKEKAKEKAKKAKQKSSGKSECPLRKCDILVASEVCNI